MAANLFYQSLSTPNLSHVKLLTWVKFDDFCADWSIYADHLTLIMYVVVCTVSSVVHIYSIGYMKDDARFNIFASYLSLFTFFMLMLVSSDNMLQMFFGWEGVGLCSYLLIGFWYEKESASLAAKKAFIVNRLADVALMIGILIIYKHYNSLNFADIANNKQLLANSSFQIFGLSLLDATCLLIFIGCMGKSAQIGLHVWLPDAMEGPTPVSALIHAATMVTAGVFLVARLNFLFEQSEYISLFIATVGAITCVFAAVIATAQTDIKKIIAYSTCSQLGYMFIACGLKAYHAAIFHLATHAFYKAALFLAAGNVIHGTDEQDIYKIGNVAAAMKVTFLIFLISSAAIIGLPPLAGFYSKDLILEYAATLNVAAFSFGVFAASCTGFYSVKILKNIFATSPKNNHAHEADLVMLLPMFILLLGSIFAGYFGIHVLNIEGQAGYFADVFKVQQVEEGTNIYVHYAPLISGIIGCLLGYLFAGNKRSLKIIENKFYFDEIYDSCIVQVAKIIALLSALLDTYVIDKMGPRNSVSAASYLSRKVSSAHTGYIFSYATWILVSVLGIAILVAFQV
jgi:NADH-quinone oxidoreductase subunit L